MYIHPESMERVQSSHLSTRHNAPGDAQAFQRVLNGVVHPGAVEASMAGTQKHMKKKHKDGQEILKDYEEEMEDYYQFLEMEKKIHTVFRKLRLEV